MFEILTLHYLFISLDPSKLWACLNIFCALLSILFTKFELVDLPPTPLPPLPPPPSTVSVDAIVLVVLISLFVEKYGINVLQTHRLYAS